MRAIAAMFLVACGSSSDDGAGTNGSVDTGITGGTPTTPACVALEDGTWTASGAAFGMAMDSTLTMDVSGCSFTLDDWTMVMGEMPTGGTLDGDQVTLAGGTGDYYASCTGTATPTEVTGICDDDGAGFTLAKK